MKTEYGTSSEHFWKSYPTYEVLRHVRQPGEKNAKWYGIIMDVKRSVLGLDGDAYIDILDVKLDPETAAAMIIAAAIAVTVIIRIRKKRREPRK